MGSALHDLSYGLSVAAHPFNLLAGALGVIVGTTIGVIPALGPTQGAALLLPIVFRLPPSTGLIFLSGLYMGAIYGGSVTSILFNIPGTPMSVASAFDGYPMALKGKGARALAGSALSAFIAGTTCVVLFTFFARPLAEYALTWGPPEYFSVMVLAYAALAGLEGGSLVKSSVSVLTGLILTTIGVDIITGMPRITFGSTDLLAGVKFLVVVVGMFGVGELLRAAEENIMSKSALKAKVRLADIVGALKEMGGYWKTFLRSTLLGFWIGVLPGTGATPASFVGYGLAKRFSKHPEKFGTGDLEGVVAPESAAASAEVGSLLPLVTLGIPGSPTAAVILGALMIWGLQPGPLLMLDHPEIVWGFIASMYIAAMLSMILNMFAIPLWTQILKIPFTVQVPLIVFLCYIGGYTENNTLFTMWMVLLFGVIGFLFKKFGYPLSPLVVAIVLGDDTESSFRRSLIMSSGDPSVFFTRPVSLFLLLLALALFLFPLVSPAMKRFRKAPPQSARLPPELDSLSVPEGAKEGRSR
ncbi:MAG TPA: tripartite tricarboxylate transporter permease [Myxococcales bacterium]|nr:tripartite tricarboxylate transporter permease [Myxococcales bacterium]